MIQTENPRATALTAGGSENNPVILWNDLFAAGTETTSIGTEQTDGEAANATSGTTYDYWSAAESSGVAAWSVDLGAADALTCVAIAAHNIGTLDGAVKIQSSSDGAAWSDVSSAVSPSDDSAVMFRFASASARHWRVHVSGLSGSDVVSIGVVMGGKELIVPRRIYQGYTPPVTPTEVTLSANRSVGGHLLGTATRRTGSSASAQFANMPATFVRAAWKLFQTHANGGGGFFWAWRPAKYGDCHFAWVTAPVIPTNSGPRDLMSADLQMSFYDG